MQNVALLVFNSAARTLSLLLRTVTTMVYFVMIAAFPVTTNNEWAGIDSACSDCHLVHTLTGRRTEESNQQLIITAKHSLRSRC